jgi:hypothetical protein
MPALVASAAASVSTGCLKRIWDLKLQWIVLFSSVIFYFFIFFWERGLRLFITPTFTFVPDEMKIASKWKILVLSFRLILLAQGHCFFNTAQRHRVGLVHCDSRITPSSVSVFSVLLVIFHTKD